MDLIACRSRAGGNPASDQESCNTPLDPCLRRDDVYDDMRIAPLAVMSSAVQWQGNDMHIARIGQVLLMLDEANALTATVNAGLLTFDDVDVTIHLAVFDEAGVLLGTAQAVEHVDRVWLGVPALMAREVTLDFDNCACYENIHSISAAATHGNVLTPEQWVGEDSESDDSEHR